MKISPLYDVIWLKPDKPDEKFGAIIIPESYRTRLWQGTIMAIGPGARPGLKVDRPFFDAVDGRRYTLRRNRWKGRTVPLDVKIGDHILINRQQAEEFEYQGEKYMVTRYDECLAVIENGVQHSQGDRREKVT